MTGAGLNQCSPTTCEGRPVPVASSVTDRAEVLVAMTASGASRPSSPLRDGLDDELAVLNAGQLGAEGDAAQQGVLVLLGQLAAADGTAGGVLEVALGPLEAGVVDLHADHVHAGAREHLGDTGTHGAQSDDTDPAESHGHSKDGEEGAASVPDGLPAGIRACQNRVGRPDSIPRSAS
jgi:hypothetical protein